ncbi:hypothetical protein ACFL2V_18765 [Pseudomonadota bacterium]
MTPSMQALASRIHIINIDGFLKASYQRFRHVSVMQRRAGIALQFLHAFIAYSELSPDVQAAITDKLVDELCREEVPELVSIINMILETAAQEEEKQGIFAEEDPTSTSTADLYAAVVHRTHDINADIRRVAEEAEAKRCIDCKETGGCIHPSCGKERSFAANANTVRESRSARIGLPSPTSIPSAAYEELYRQVSLERNPAAEIATAFFLNALTSDDPEIISEHLGILSSSKGGQNNPIPFKWLVAYRQIQLYRKVGVITPGLIDSAAYKRLYKDIVSDDAHALSLTIEFLTHLKAGDTTRVNRIIETMRNTPDTPKEWVVAFKQIKALYLTKHQVALAEKIRGRMDAGKIRIVENPPRQRSYDARTQPAIPRSMRPQLRPVKAGPTVPPPKKVKPKEGPLARLLGRKQGK